MLLKRHSKEDNDVAVKGVGKTATRTAKDFTNDPLASSDNTSTVNKPGTSIPSLFARMIFFQAAFEGADPQKYDIQGNNAIPVYNQIISLCLDVLELVYTRNPHLTFEHWNSGKQIEQMMKQKTNQDLARAINQQRIDFLSSATDIHLFYLNGKLIGGTSPFTFVFAAPDWKGNGTVKSLHQRDEKFREFVYKLMLAYGGTPQMGEFMGYVRHCQQFGEPSPRLRALDAGNYGPAQLDEEYDILQYTDRLTGVKEKAYVMQNPQVPLYVRSAAAFSSDFFIASSFTQGNPIDPNAMPLFLHPGWGHTHLRYYDDTLWDGQTQFESVPGDDNDTRERSLPGNAPYQHAYLSWRDFLEPVLIELPYPVNTDRFKGIVNGEKSYLLPLRPMLFKYFKMEAVNNMFNYSVSEGTCTVTLTVPVRDASGTVLNNIVVEQQYNLATDTRRWASGGESVNLALFPFYRLPDSLGMSNRYVVMHNINTDNKAYASSELKFFKEQDGLPITLPTGGIQGGSQPLSIYYDVPEAFNYVQMCWKSGNGNNDVAGVIIPIFESGIKSGGKQFIYSIDFGTTNTHIAYMWDGGDMAESFSAAELQSQAVFLNTINPKVYNNSCGRDNPQFMLKEARHFFPNVNDSSYTFPFRTVTKENGPLTAASSIFSGASIGFHYSKEFVHDDSYCTTLKWDMENSNPTPAIAKRLQSFFEETLWMIKNHWLLSKTSDKNVKPKIVITYPQAMTQRASLMRKWTVAYDQMFGGSEGSAKVSEMVESLAPCYQLINSGAPSSEGILNIDIGGGTTDLQFYRKYPFGAINRTVCLYNSVLFAGDDLWGVGYENVTGIQMGGINGNNFTHEAANVLSQAVINLENKDNHSKDINFARISTQLKPKEVINILLRDLNCNFTDWLSQNTVTICRKTMFLHYMAIMYYTAIWIRDNTNMVIPATVHFTGLGSKYIKLLFDTDEKLTQFTKLVMERVTKKEAPVGFQVSFAANPKNATAEGASLFTARKNNPVSNMVSYHSGIPSGTAKPKVNELAGKVNDVLEAFKEFIAVYNALPSDVGGVYIPKLSKEEVDAFVNDARISINQMVSSCVDNFQSMEGARVNDALFFWAFKGSLYKLI